MDARAQFIDQEISRHAATLGAYHAQGFSESCRKAMSSAMAHVTAESEDEIAAAVALFAQDYITGVESERKRITEIDALAKQLMPGHEAAVWAAKFETLITAGELATRILSAHRTALEMPRKIQ